jgi:hypothetical protein
LAIGKKGKEIRNLCNFGGCAASLICKELAMQAKPLTQGNGVLQDSPLDALR